METQIVNATEYRNVSLALLTESKTNPRRTFEETALKELAESIRTQGVLSPLLVRPLTENSFEIIAGARRYRAAQMAEAPAVPVRIVHLSDASALEAQLVENLIRSEIHPMEEAQGCRALLDLEDPKYSIEQIAAKVGKSPVFVASRLKLSDLVPAAVDAFYADEIGVGHALLLAKLPADQQEGALSACFKEVYNGASKPARILLPVRNLQFWTDSNILLVLKDAPFNKRDTQLVPTAGSCADCPKRTGHNKLLFGDDLGRQGDRCTDPNCYAAKVLAHVAQTVAAKPELVQVSTAYGGQKEGSSVLPRNKYTAIRDDKPKSKDDAKRPEFKVCKFTTEAIITEGSDVGTIHKVCANPSCPVHHPKQSTSRNDEKWKAEQDKQRKEQAIANTTGLRVLAAVSAAVPVRLLKRDLLFVMEKLISVMDENRVEMLARQHGIRQKRDDGGIGKTLTALVRRADEGTLSRLLVETSILLASSRGNPSSVLKDAATAYKVDTDAIAAKVKQEFAAKKKAKKTPPPPTKTAKKAA
ncbi:Chromosome (plasmid) partitioning protein ParB [Acidisarcina polymorpha]|uniref:Chromosome (Plasmid) partitioning protein ParB n=1 Tax=Acidisarcina polymorpha TaxID=2211140 RepID=A0A2Z5FZB6_9BACT|nr:ParB/RepB/Spo0J family partition protein [Acidisarcina polymorpha]AXC12152.1 Chromosome (plasmid) partitioning protein ParB [Acidisarcina polymorpha]